ncbi:hypothetical protein BDR04DRAFT_1143998 [Suillus decipiens]|nr:hypothetical protein BDR04DRAFT_1143998 [Suillus decipiens]
MSLLKIPLVLSSAIAFHVAVTPPHFASTEEIRGVLGRGSGRILRAASEALSTLTDVPITPTFLVGCGLMTSGGFIRRLCYRTLGRHFTFMLSIRRGHRLVTTEPYAIVRHPSYTGMMVMCLGIIIMHGSRDSWIRASGISAKIPGVVLPVVIAGISICAAVNVFLFSRTRVEDEMMHSAFGEEWEAWARKVKYRIIPGVY